MRKIRKDRVWHKYEIQPNGCWFAPNKPMPSGYVRVEINGKGRALHRVYYEQFVGPIPEGLQLDHLCRTPRCVNPAHLEPVTPRENTMRSPIAPAALNAAKTHCPQDHPYEGENLVVNVNGQRCCRICLRTAQRRHYRNGGKAKIRAWQKDNREKINARKREMRAKGLWT